MVPASLVITTAYQYDVIVTLVVQCSTLRPARLPGASKSWVRASESSSPVARRGKWISELIFSQMRKKFYFSQTFHRPVPATAAIVFFSSQLSSSVRLREILDRGRRQDGDHRSSV